MTHVLVAYATRHGSTEQVAGAIAAVLRAQGCDATVVDAGSVRAPVTGYDLVILGAPLYSGRWHAGARRFLRRHRRELVSLPVAVFALGPRRDDEEAWRRSWLQLDRALARRPWFVPVSVGLFGGADPPRRQGERRDLRDWGEIGEWTRKLPASRSVDHG